MAHKPVKLMHCDLNWAADPHQRPAAPHDWAFIDPKEYFDWHMEFGTNVMYCQAYLFGGTALYPSKLGPVAPGPGSQLFPRLYELARAAEVPVWSYFCVGADLVMSNHRQDWVVPGSRAWTEPGGSDGWCSFGFLAPESGWTDLLCARMQEFLEMYPVDWLLFDWFGYGGLTPNIDPVVPAEYAREPFERIIGRAMPETTAEISPAEQMKYKRTVLTEQFRRIQTAVRAVSPETKIMFNVPYREPAEEIWIGHPMLEESDGLFAECSRPDVMDWLLEIRRPEQRVMTTITGRTQEGECDPASWRRWYEEGCDFFGYAWGQLPDFRPHPRYAEEIEIVRNAFAEMDRLN
ncbi:MAG: hypothetical protein ACLFWL_00445 [Candidatus Brocadiia bacterium]